MATISRDGTLLQTPKQDFSNQLPGSIRFDQLTEATFDQYEDASGRPADPDWQRTQPPANRQHPGSGEWPYPCAIIDFTWHHVIPWNMLCSFWGALAREQQWRLLEQFLRVLDVPDPHTKILHMKAANGGALTDTEIDEVHEHLCWRKWNVVEGPLNTLRIDDPGEEFDEFKYGLPSEKAVQRMKDLKDVYQAMRAYVGAADRRRREVWEQRRAGKGVSATDPPIPLSNLLGERTYGHRAAGLIMFRIEMWQMVTQGSRRSGVWVWDVKPTWKVATKERSEQAIENVLDKWREQFG